MVAAYSGEKLIPREEAIFRHLKLGRVLDLGCGTGRATVCLTHMGFNIVGLDLSEAMIVEARRLHPGLSFMLGDACDLSAFEETEFDYVLFSYNGLDLIHPLEMRMRCLQEVHRILRSGGLFIYNSHNRAWMDAHPERSRPIGGGYFQFHNPHGPEVVYATQMDEQIQQLSEVGLKMISCYMGDTFNYYVAEKAHGISKVRIIEASPQPLSPPRRALRKLGRMLAPPLRKTIVIDLTRPMDELWSSVKKTRRHEIAQGETRMKARVVKPSDSEEYMVFDSAWSREMGLFPLPRKWLTEGHLFLAHDEQGKLVAAILAHVRGRSLVIRRDSALRDEEEIHAALTWYAVRWAKEHGFMELDQGGYNKERHPGVSFWKSRFGGCVTDRRVPDV